MSTELMSPEVGISLEEAIKEFVRIKNRAAELAEEEKRLLDVLVPAAIEARQDTKTARIANHDRSVVLKVEFHSYVKCSTQGLNQVRELLGDDVFEDLFKTEYKPMLRTLKPFLATKTTDERIETAKEIIAQSLRESAETPRFSIEKG